MSNSILQRAAAWLCLAVAILTGFSPAQGFVICLEPDGRVSVEIATSAEACGGCESPRDHTTTPKPTVRSAQVSDCPCVDLPVPGTSQERGLQRQPIQLRPGSWIACPLPSFARPLVPLPLAVRASPPGPPRPAESLARIRSVVLLV